MHPVKAPRRDPRGLGATRRARLLARQRGRAGKVLPEPTARRAATSACSSAWRCPRARPSTTCPASSAPPRTMRRRCCAPPAPHAPRLGICFHVGSQCLDPSAYERALALAGAVIERPACEIDVLDVGGGFPVTYPGVDAAAAGRLHRRHRGAASSALALPARTALWCEPGRALVAPAASRGGAGEQAPRAMSCTSTTASMAACPMPARRRSASRPG